MIRRGPALRGLPAAAALTLLAAVLSGCGTARPVHTSHPRPDVTTPPPGPSPGAVHETGPFGGDIHVRVALHWSRGSVRVASTGALTFHDGGAAGRIVPIDKGGVLVASCSGSEVRVRTASGRVLAEGSTARVTPDGGRLVVDGREVRGEIRFAARADSLFVVNELALEDYLRGVVPKEIGPRPPADREAVAAQAVAARTYTVKRLNQYESLPFDLFGDVQDQVYDGVAGEQDVADAAILETRGIVLADDRTLIETFYSSTCGGARSDIAAVWPNRAVHPALRGGPDGPRGREWCRESRHFQWEEEWDGRELGAMFRKYAPALLDLPAGSIRGELRDV
ncbi:SpoIID/LytB domain-containing protein, partial [bacterium]|nr:SpoIID/LytB domain-containing protein [bacterium]